MSSYTITHHGTDQVFRINHHGIPTKQEFYYSRRKWIMNTILLPPFLIALWLLPVLGVWVIGDKEMLMFWAISLLLTGGAIGITLDSPKAYSSPEQALKAAIRSKMRSEYWEKRLEEYNQERLTGA